VNFAKPQRIKEGSTRPVWSEDTWLQQHAGETLEKKDEKKEEEGGATEAGENKVFIKNSVCVSSVCNFLVYSEWRAAQ
jgi:hypothetical protein